MKLEIRFYPKYNGGVKCEAIDTDGVKYIIDIDYIEKFLEKLVESRGCTFEKTKAQKFSRLIINK